MSTVREYTPNICVTFSASITSPMSSSMPSMSSRPPLSSLVSTMAGGLVDSHAMDSCRPRRSNVFDLRRHCYKTGNTTHHALLTGALRGLETDFFSIFSIVSDIFYLFDIYIEHFQIHCSNYMKFSTK